jgi:MscS family membrane protein
VLIVQQWGYNVTSLLAGLGIGGLAFALAAKPTLSNWFGSLMIFTDRPFNIGDRIDIDAGEGVVEEVGLRSTRIRTREDSLISIPNADIAGKPIENLSARRERRIEVSVGLTYGTTADQIREVVGGIEELLDDHERIDGEESIVRFRDFGDSALVVYVDCYAQTTDRQTYFEIGEEIHFGIAEIVEEAGSSFAFPSRTLYFDDEIEVTAPDE